MRVRTPWVFSVTVLLLSLGATALLSDVQRLHGAATLDPGTPHAVPKVTRRPHVAPHRSTPETRHEVIDRVQAAEPEVAFSPSPRYPIRALRAQRQGVVRVRLQLDAEGKVTAARLEHSSGDVELDQAALKAVRRWRFTMPPHARREVVLPIRFRIDEPQR
jgi:protein TonB